MYLKDGILVNTSGSSSLSVSSDGSANNSEIEDEIDARKTNKEELRGWAVSCCDCRREKHTRIFPCGHHFCDQCMSGSQNVEDIDHGAAHRCKRCSSASTVPTSKLLCNYAGDRWLGIAPARASLIGDTSPRVNCHLHSLIPLSFFCTYCSQPVCEECVTTDHRGHPFKELSHEHVEKEVTHFETVAHMIDSRLDYIMKTEKKLPHARDRLSELHSNITDEIEQRYQQYLTELQDRKNFLMMELRKCTTECAERLERSEKILGSDRRQLGRYLAHYKAHCKANTTPAERMQCNAALESPLELVLQHRFLELDKDLSEMLVYSQPESIAAHTTNLMGSLVFLDPNLSLISKQGLPSNTSAQNLIAKANNNPLGAIGDGRKSTHCLTNLPDHMYSSSVEGWSNGSDCKENMPPANSILTIDKDFGPWTQGSEKSSSPLSPDLGSMCAELPLPPANLNQALATPSTAAGLEQLFTVATPAANNAALLELSVGGNSAPIEAMMRLHLASSSPPALPLVARAKMQYHMKFGEFGVTEGQFTEPSGVAVNAQQDIVVADTNNHRVQVFTSTGIFRYQFGENGRRNGQFMYPNRVAVHRATGDIVVTERSPTHQVQVYTQYGNFVRKFGSHILQHPRGVCVDKDGRIIVVECKVMRVVIFDSMGNVLKSFKCNRLQFPNSIAVDNNYRIYISDNRAHCIRVFNYHGAYLGQIGFSGLTNYPIGVAVRSDGNILVADNHNNFNVTVFSPQGQLVQALESKVKHAQCFDIDLLDDGSIVLASKDYRIYVYKYLMHDSGISASSSAVLPSVINPPL